MRAFLMLVGIPYHASLVYSGHHWFVDGVHSSESMTLLTDFLHLWRMPIFFVLAGFFAGLVVVRKGNRVWAVDRATRLGVPLLAGMFVVNSFQSLILAYWADEPTREVLLARFGSIQAWVEQLWFLVDLLIFCALFLFVRITPAGRSLIDRLSLGMSKSVRSRQTRLLIIGLVAAALASSATVWDEAALSLAVPTANLFLFGMCFLVGVLIAGRTETLSALTPRSATEAFSLAILSAVVTLMLDRFGGSPPDWFLQRWTTMLGMLFAAGGLLALTSKRNAAPDARIRWLVDASLIIYVFHHPLIIAYGILFNGLPPWIGFMAVSLLTFISCAALYELIARFEATRLIFNGSRRPIATWASSRSSPAA